MKIVLVRLSEALIAGSLEIVTPQIYTDATPMKEELACRASKICVNRCSSVAPQDRKNDASSRTTESFNLCARSTAEFGASFGRERVSLFLVVAISALLGGGWYLARKVSAGNGVTR